MDKIKQPGISVDAIFLRKITFERKPQINSREINTDFKSVINFSKNKKNLTYELICNISDKNKSFNLECSMIGLFSYLTDKKNLDLEIFSQNNAPAIIMPYLREVVTATSTRAGLSPIILPPINIIALFKNRQKQTE